MTYLVLLFVSFSAFAQSLYTPNELQPIPHLESNESFQLHTQTFSRPKPNKKLRREAIQVGRYFRSNFAAIAANLNPVPRNCNSMEAVRYTEALLQSGHWQISQDFIESCLRTSSPIHQGVYLFAASAVAELNKHARADQLFAAGLKVPATDFLDMLVYQYASFAKFGIYPHKVTSIIALHPQWKDKVNVVDGLLEYAAFARTTKASIAQIESLLSQLHTSTNSWTRSFFLNVKLMTLIRLKQFEAAKNFLNQNASAMTQPASIWFRAYETFYVQSPSTFKYAQAIYDPVLPYLHPDSVFPMEYNTYNYTELYQSACRNQLLQGSDYQSLMTIRQKWKSGQLSTGQAITQLEGLNQSKPQRADVLSMLGGLYRIEGRIQTAKAKYWQAHQACPYYNRSHWGLRLLSRKADYESYPEYQQIENKVAQVASSAPWPTQPDQYFLNWNQFSNLIHKHVIYGARIWLSHIPYLVQNQLTTYLKLDFELLSESPNLADIRDQRIGSANYPNDNRLWDDVRGLGGRTVVSDIWETYYTAHGDYNLLGHEMAHQFQRAAELNSDAAAKNIVDCIVSLYAAAKQNNNFPDGYSAQNKEEHFAQGVTYYLVPKDSPPRFGLNQSWVETNDPKQFRFVQTIDNSDGQLQRVSCL